MWFFKKQKRAVTEEDIFSKDPLDDLPVSPFRNTPEYKRIESLFHQANELYTQAKNILGERKPQDLDDESKKKYFDLLTESYNTLISRAHDKGLYFSYRLSVQIERQLLSLHRDLALCYSEGIGVTVNDYERGRHLEVEGFLLSHCLYATDFEPSDELRFRKKV